MPACSLVSLLTHPPPILISLSGCLGVTSRHKKKCSSKPNNRSDSPTAAASLLDTGHHWLTRQQACFTSVSLRITLPFLLKITPRPPSLTPVRLKSCSKSLQQMGATRKSEGREIRRFLTAAATRHHCCGAGATVCVVSEPGSNLWCGFCACVVSPCVPASLLAMLHT